MEKMKRFKIYNYNISLHKMRSQFKDEEETIMSCSASNKFALEMLSKTGIDKSLLTQFDTSIYDSIFFTSRGIYCLICDTAGRYLTHILVRYENVNSINLFIRYDFITMHIKTNNGYNYNGELYGDISQEQKKLLKTFNITVTDSKIVSLFDHSELILNKAIKKVLNFKKQPPSTIEHTNQDFLSK